MQAMIDILIAVVTATVILGVFITQTSRNRAELEVAIKNIQRDLKNTASIMHEYRKFRAAFDASYDAIVITDVEGKILFMNESATRVTGFSRSEAMGTKAGKLWGGLMPKKYYTELWKRIKKQQQPFYGTIKNHRKNGQKYTAAVSISPIFDDDHAKVQYFVAVERDLGEKL